MFCIMIMAIIALLFAECAVKSIENKWFAAGGVVLLILFYPFVQYMESDAFWNIRITRQEFPASDVSIAEANIQDNDSGTTVIFHSPDGTMQLAKFNPVSADNSTVIVERVEKYDKWSDALQAIEYRITASPESLQQNTGEQRSGG